MQEVASPSSPPKRRRFAWLRRVLRWLWLTVALLLGLFGLLALVLQFAILPHIDSFRPQLEQAASRALGKPVHIGRIVLLEQGWEPTIAMEQLVVEDGTGRHGLRVQSVQAVVSLQAALLRSGFERLSVFTPELEARRNPDGTVEVAGVKLAQGKGGDSGPALNWLLSQPELAIHNGSIRWTDDQRQQAPLLLSKVEASLTNSGTSHALQLNATPPQGWGQPILFVSEWSHPMFGDRTLWRNWNGVAYADMPELDVSQLRRYMEIGHNVDLRKGHGRLRVWADFKEMRSSTATIDAQLDEVDMTLGQGLPPLALKNIKSMFSVQFASDAQPSEEKNPPQTPANSTYTFNTQELSFTTLSNRQWSGGNVRVEMNNGTQRADSSGRVEGDNWDLGIIFELAGSLPLGEAMLEALETYQPGGHLDDIAVTWQGNINQPTAYTAKGSAKQIGWLSRQGPYNRKKGRFEPGVPGVEGAAVAFDLTERGGTMDIAMRKGNVVLPGVFEEPRIPFDRFDAKVLWEIDGDHIRAHLPEVRFANADARGSLKAEWRTRELTGDEPAANRFPGLLDLSATMESARAERVYRYLPLSLGERAREYVQLAVRDGDIRNAKITIKGDLDHIPNQRDKDGKPVPSVFRFEVPLVNANYQFLPPKLQKPGDLPWPALTHLNGKLIIDHNRLEIVDAKARFSTAPDLVVHELGATVPDLAHNLTVGVAARASGPLSQALHLANTSPLTVIANHALEKATATGNTDLTIALGLPINNMDHAKVEGQVVLKGNDLRITPETPLLAGSTGAVAFTEKGFELRQVRTRMLGGSAVLAGGLKSATRPGEKRQIVFNAEGDFSAEGLRQERMVSFVAPLAGYMQGRSRYKARLQFDRGAPELTIDTDLNGMALNLPAPLSKPAAGSLPLHIENTVVSNYTDRNGKLMPAEDRLLVRAGQQVSVHYVRDVRGAEPRVLRGSIAIGERAHENLPPLPDSDVHALVLLDAVDVDAWQQVLQRISSAPSMAGSSQGSGSGDDLSYLPSVLAIQTTSLKIAGRNLENLVIGGSREGRLWRFTLDSRQINGYVEYLQPRGNSMGSVKARLARLIIEPAQVEDVKEIVRKTEDPERLPALDIEATNVDVLGYKLDKLVLLASNSATPMTADAPLVDDPEDASTGWRIHQLTATVPNTVLHGSGVWGQPRNARLPDGTPARRFVALNVRLETTNLGNMMDHFGATDLVAGGAGVLAGTIRWRGSPISIDMATLDGTVRMDVRNGRVTKIDPGAARLINLFSLQALSRLGANPGRGFGFDRVGGTLRINNGIVQTDDTEVIGTTMADVKVNGQASLLDQTLDLDVLVQPKIDLGSTALIAAAVNPAIGLGTYFAQLLLSESINAAATQVLHISGPWNKPQVDTLKGEVASETARRILLSHATPGPVDPLWDWWPVTGSSLMWDWWPVTGQGSNYFGSYSVPPTVPLRALPADAPEAAAAASEPAAAGAEPMAPAATPSVPLAPEAPGTPAPETGILPATRPSAPVSEPELVH